MKKYDDFQEGDRVWSEVWGFAEVGMVSIPTKSVVLSIESDGIAFSDSCTFDGRHHFCRKRPRYVFHAVAETDEKMRAAIARGEGLKRLVPRGRWPIQPGDRVMVCQNYNFTPDEEIANQGDGQYPIKVGDRTYTQCGMYHLGNKHPIVMRLYDGEEPFEDRCENIRWMMDEAVKADWTNKIKGKV